MNVRVPKPDSRERTHAYGLALQVQDGILERMSNLMKDMRVKDKSTLLPFQKGKTDLIIFAININIYFNRYHSIE